MAHIEQTAHVVEPLEEDKQLGRTVNKAEFSRLKRLPQVRVFTGSDFELLNEEQDVGIRAGLAVSYPIYDAGGIKREIEAAESNFRRAKIQLSVSKAEAELETKEAYWNYINKIKLCQIADERKVLMEKSYRKSKEDLARKSLSQVQFEEAELDYLRSLQTYRDLQLEVILAREKLLKVVGVGSIDDMKSSVAGHTAAISGIDSEEVRN